MNAVENQILEHWHLVSKDGFRSLALGGRRGGEEGGGVVGIM